MKSVVLLFGPSGAGKSTLATWLSQDLGMVHINFDDWDHLGVDGQPLQRDFDTFMTRYRGERLREDIRSILSREHAQSAVLTFPSDIVPTIDNLKEAQRELMTPIILFGPRSECYQAFLALDRASDHPLPIDHWPRHNKNAYKTYDRPEYRPYVEIVFPRRTKDALLAAVKARTEVLV